MSEAMAQAQAQVQAQAGWLGELSLHYTRDAHGRTVAHDRHHGPLRVLQRLYPEGPGICHHVLVHPPGGVAGGDVLHLQARLEPGTHALVTTPGATRFYRSAGRPALQRAELQLHGDARLEWLPLEAIAYDGCLAENQVRFTLDDEAQLMGWDLLALGLPAADAPFARGEFLQHLEWPGHWLERGRLRADDTLLRTSPLGLAGHEVLATLWFARGRAWPDALAQGLLDDARELGAAGPLASTYGATQPQPGLVLLRLLAPRVEPAMALLRAVRGRWRERAWGLPAAEPRIWRS
jgi:urease accessory protein